MINASKYALDKAMQVGSCKICQECVDAAASVNVEESTESLNVQKKLRVNELLACVNTYIHQSSKLKSVIYSSLIPQG